MRADAVQQTTKNIAVDAINNNSNCGARALSDVIRRGGVAKGRIGPEGPDT